MNIQAANSSPASVSGKPAPAQDMGAAHALSSVDSAPTFVDVLATIAISPDPVPELPSGKDESAPTDDDASRGHSAGSDQVQTIQPLPLPQYVGTPVNLPVTLIMSGGLGQESAPLPLSQDESLVRTGSKDGGAGIARLANSLSVQLQSTAGKASYEAPAPSTVTANLAPAAPVAEDAFQLSPALKSYSLETENRIDDSVGAGSDLQVTKLADSKGPGAVDSQAFSSLVSSVSPQITVTTVKLPPGGSPEQWRHSLLEALGERIQISTGKHAEQAVIRLDPPMMGSIEVSIRHQAGSLQVQLSATNNDVLRQLQSISESLRHDLVQRQYNDVSVAVYTGSRQGGGGQQSDNQEEHAPGRALAEAEEGQPATGFAHAFANA